MDSISGELASRAVTQPLLVTDSGVLRGPIFQRIRRLIPHVELFDEVTASPTEKSVLDGAELFVTSGCNGIVALGGGSVLDVAKAIRLKIHHPLPLAHYDAAASKVTPEMPVLIAVPTTGGTGSEVSSAAIIALDQAGRRKIIRSPHLMPSVAIVDPELSLDLPPAITAGSGMTAFAHCVESFLSPGYHPLCDAMAAEGARLVIEALPRAMRNPKDIEARRDMMLAATSGALAAQKDPGISSIMAGVLCSATGMHHGAAVAVLLPEVLEFLGGGMDDRFTALAQRTGVASIPQAARELLRRTGLHPRLAAHHVNGHHLAEYARIAFEDLAAFAEPRCAQADLLAIYRRAW